jgi:hypothetical protein
MKESFATIIQKPSFTHILYYMLYDRSIDNIYFYMIYFRDCALNDYKGRQRRKVSWNLETILWNIHWGL